MRSERVDSVPGDTRLTTMSSCRRSRNDEEARYLETLGDRAGGSIRIPR